MIRAAFALVCVLSVIALTGCATPPVADTSAPPGYHRDRTTPEPPGLANASAPVNGLVARLEFIGEPRTYSEGRYLIRVKNVSDHPIRVPGAQSLSFTLDYRTRGEWHRHERELWVVCNDDDQEHLPEFTLRPGESLILQIGGVRSGYAADEYRLAIEAPETHASCWSGYLVTPGASRGVIEERGREPLPTYLPRFSRGRAGWSFGFHNYYDVKRAENQAVLKVLARYNPEEVRVAFERRARSDPDHFNRIFYASVAADLGSEEGWATLVHERQTLDYEPLIMTHQAIGSLLSNPRWRSAATAELLKGLRDQRQVRLPEYFSSDEMMTVSCVVEEPGEATLKFGHAGVVEAVPYLIELMHTTDARRGLVWALADIGDPRAKPVILEYLRKHADTAEYSSWSGLSEPFDTLVEAAIQLHIVEAVPVLLRFTQSPRVVEGLGKLGGPEAEQALRAIAADPSTDPDRRSAALLGLAKMGDPAVGDQLLPLLSDSNVSSSERHNLIEFFTKHPDPRALPGLMHVIRSDPDGSVVHRAIAAVSRYPSLDAVEGLLSLLDFDFSAKRQGNGWPTADDLRARVVESLRQITGQSFGPNAAQWRTWWQEIGRHEPRFQ